VDDGQLTRRLLLAGIGSAAVAGLSGCSLTSATKPTPMEAGSPGPATPRPSGSGSGRPASAVAIPDEAGLRRKIASLLVAGFRGQQVNDGDWIVRAIRGGLGGVVLFDRELHTDEPRNITSPAQVTALVKQLRQAAPGPLIVSMDQEGGQTSRLNPDDGFPATRSEADIGAANNNDTTKAWAQGMVHSMSAIGVNLNYAPVVDLNVNPDNPAIGKLGRSFSDNPDVVVGNAGEEIKVHRSANIKTVLKHFPGLGSATANTDFDVVDVSDTWHRNELEPFQRLISAGLADCVMAAHLLNTQLDPSRPASLSPAMVTNLLRGQLGFKGPVVSDDMQAVAITAKYGADQAVAMALEAGLDLLVFANQQVYDENVVTSTLDTVVDLVRQGRITQQRIDQSVARVNSLRPKK
jgi:beta-N-acetylhexosaminidase